MSGPRGNEPRRRAIAVLVAITAVSSSAWAVAVGGTARAPFPLVTTSLDGVVAVAQLVAAVLVARATTKLVVGALAFLAVPLWAHAVVLPSHVVFVLESPQWSPQWPMAWATATACVALGAALLVLAELVSLRGADGGEAPPNPVRFGAGSGAALLASSSMFAWTVSSSAAPERFAPVIGSADLAVTISSWLGVAVLVGTAAALVRSRSWTITIGLMLGAVVTRPLAPSMLVDPAWRASGMSLAVGWWLALTGQVLLAACLVALVWLRGATEPTTSANAVASS